MSEWSYDITKAPRGKTVQTEQFRKGTNGHVKAVMVETFVPEWIWAATRGGEVVRTHWLPPEPKHRPNGRWLNLHSEEQPIAWQPYVVPSHPGLTESTHSPHPADGEAA